MTTHKIPNTDFTTIGWRLNYQEVIVRESIIIQSSQIPIIWCQRVRVAKKANAMTTFNIIRNYQTIVGLRTCTSTIENIYPSTCKANDYIKDKNDYVNSSPGTWYQVIEVAMNYMSLKHWCLWY